MARKDLPSPSSPNFLARVREEIHALLGKTGSASERALTLRDAIASGVIATGPGGSLIPGPGAGAEPYEPDLTPPPTPDSLTATPAISHILLEVPAATYTQGHGHLRTRVYGATWQTGDPLPVFADAVEVGQFGGTVWAMPSNPSTTWHLWAKWESVDGVLSASPVGGTNGVAATTGQDVSSLLDALAGQLAEDQLLNSLKSRIDLIDGPSSMAGSVAARLASEATARANAIAAEASTRAQAVLDEAAARASGDSALQTQINMLSAAGSGDFAELLAAVQEEQEARVAGDAAEATARQTLAAQMRGSYEGTDPDELTTGLLYNERQARVDADGALSSSISSLSATLTSNFNTLSASISAEQTARVNADGALSTSISTVSAVANAKNKTYYQAAAPTTGITAGDLWFDSDDSNKAYRYSGTAWVQTSDTRIDAAAAAISTEQTARANGDAALASQITTLNNSLTTTNTNVTAAQTAANNAATLAGSKGKVIVQSAAPAAADRLAQNLWIDTTGNANTPKRWNGSAWVSVTDKVATDAAAAAAAAQATADTKADASALNALTTRVTTAENSISSQGSSITSLQNSLATTNNTVATKADASALSSLSSTVTSQGTTITSQGTAITGLQNSVSTINGTLANKADVSALNTLSTTVTNQGNTLTAQGSSITSLQSSVAANAAAIQTEATTRASETGNLFAKYTVKVDVAGHVSGYGLASTANNGAVVSQFGIRADQFFVAPPATSRATAPTTNLYKGMVWVDTSVTPNVTRYYTGSAWSTTPQVLPFVVQTTPTTINGVAVPAGAYFNDAFIQNGTITNAKIANLAVDDAKIANLSVSKLTAGSLAVGQYAQSTGYVAGSSGWRINGDGTAEFSGVVVRGTIFASQGAIGGWTIGSNYLQSTTYVLGTSGTRFNSDGTGQIGGITIYAEGLGAGSTAYDTGNGAWIGRDGKLSLKSATNSLKWDGTNLTINGGGTFSGALSAATGTFAGSLSAATGTFSGALSAATGTFSGSLTANAVNAVNTINLANNAVSVLASASGTNSGAISTTLYVPANQTMRVVAFGFKREISFGNNFTPSTVSISIDGTTVTSEVGATVFTGDGLGGTAWSEPATTVFGVRNCDGGGGGRNITVSVTTTGGNRTKSLAAFGTLR